MKIARQFFRAAILCTLVLPGGPVAAQPHPSSAGDAAGREAPWMEAGGYDPAAQRGLLEEALGRYRDIARDGGWPEVPTDLVMGPGYAYDCWRIVTLERRLIAEGYLRRKSPPPPPPPATTKAQPSRREAPVPSGGLCEYGPALTAAMRAFQIDRKVLGFGQLGSQTMTQLNRPVREIVGILEHDLARWRNVSLDASGTYLLVSIPFFELGVFEKDREIMRMPVVVGLPSWQTPLFSDEVEHIIVNPDWGIPENIAKQEYWPTAKRDSGYLRRQGITAEGGSLRQKPGPNNPLGRIKFVLPNPYDVYLHDTPAKGAFNAAVRALSHGCIRLGRPLDLANYLLRDEEQWDGRRVEAAIASKKTMQINLDRPMLVHIIYSTSRVNEKGHVELRPDVYGKNKGALSKGPHVPTADDENLESWP